MRTTVFLGLVCLLFSTLGASCKTKREIRREQEYEKIKAEVREAKGTRADLDIVSEQLRTELAQMSSRVDDLSQLQKNQAEELRKEIEALNGKVQTLEQQLAANNQPPANTPEETKPPASYDSARTLFNQRQYEDAIEEAKTVLRNTPKASKEARRTQFLLAESYFAAKDFGAAALEFSQFKRSYPKDVNVGLATLRQAQSFRNMGKEKEARLFYQEVIEKFPASASAARAKKELKKR